MRGSTGEGKRACKGAEAGTGWGKGAYSHPQEVPALPAFCVLETFYEKEGAWCQLALLQRREGEFQISLGCPSLFYWMVLPYNIWMMQGFEIWKVLFCKCKLWTGLLLKLFQLNLWLAVWRPFLILHARLRVFEDASCLCSLGVMASRESAAFGLGMYIEHIYGTLWSRWCAKVLFVKHYSYGGSMQWSFHGRSILETLFHVLVLERH